MPTLKHELTLQLVTYGTFEFYTPDLYLEISEFASYGAVISFVLVPRRLLLNSTGPF